MDGCRSDSARLADDAKVERAKNNRLIVYVGLLLRALAAVGAARGGVEFMRDVAVCACVSVRLCSDSAPKDSIAVTLPANLNFKAAIMVLADSAHGAAHFDPACPADLLKAPVNPGSIRGRDARELMELIRYRLPARFQEVKITINVLPNGGVYDISCSG